MCAYARVCCVRAWMRVCWEVVSLSLVFIPSGIEAQFQTSLRAVHIPLDCFLLRTFSPFQSSPQFENRKCTCNMLRGRGRTLWFFPDFYIRWRMCVRMDFWDPRWRDTKRWGVGSRFCWRAMGSLYSAMPAGLALGDYWFFSWLLLSSLTWNF